MIVVVINDVQKESLDVESDPGVGVVIVNQCSKFCVQGARFAPGFALWEAIDEEVEEDEEQYEFDHGLDVTHSDWQIYCNIGFN